MDLKSIIESIDNLPSAYVVIGAPLSGKTTWINKFIEKRSQNFINLNISNYSSIEERANMLEAALDFKKNIIIEGVALREERMDSLLLRLKNNGYEAVLVYLKTDYSLKEDKNIIKLKEKNSILFNIIKDKFNRIVEVE